jgi:hypothetical protein
MSTVEAGGLRGRVEAGQHQVDVLREAAMDGHLGGGRLLVLTEDPLGRIHLGKPLPSRSTVTCAVIICFWPSSVTDRASCRTTKSPTATCCPA